MSEQFKPTRGLARHHVHVIGATVCAMMLVVAWFALIGPAWSARSQSIRQRETIAAQQRQAEHLKTQMIQVERELTQVRQQELDSPLRLDAVSKINQRVSMLSNMAADARLQVTMIQPGRVQPQPRFDVVALHMEGEGTYKDTASFLHRVHEQYPDMGVASVKVRAKPNDKSGNGQFKVALIWYAAPEARRMTAEVGVGD